LCPELMDFSLGGIGFWSALALIGDEAEHPETRANNEIKRTVRNN
jgi:hypothetical protein